MTKEKNRLGRRAFMKRAGATIAVFPAIVPASVFGEEVQARTTGEDGIYYRMKDGTYSIPSELRRIRKTQTSKEMNWIVNAKAANMRPENWQSDPSRIIYHDGMYHMWMIDFDLDDCVEGRFWKNQNFPNTPEGQAFRPVNSRIRYLTSKDTRRWTAHDHLSLGPRGSCYDLLLEQVNVVAHEGRFYLFTEVWTTNIEKYGHRMLGIICLVADSPAGPWKQPPGVDILLKPERDGKSFDSDRVMNPRHVFLDGKWYMYYKGIQKPGASQTQTGLAIADSITGPYRKYKGNPILIGHGHFCWRYKHGMLMIPNYGKGTERWIHWSEDGIHFAPIAKSSNVFLFGSLYSPYDPLFGEPQAKQPTQEFWGFESVRPSGRSGKKPSGRGGRWDWDVERIEWRIG